MSHIEELIQHEQYEAILALNEAELSGKDVFYYVSALLALGKGKEAMEVLARRRDELYALDPELTLKANFETRFLLKQFEQADEDLQHFAELPYVSQRVEETLRALPKAIAHQRSATSFRPDLESALETLASPENDFALLLALDTLKNVGELEEYRGLVEELLTRPYHDSVKTYALMLLSAKGSNHETLLLKRGKTYRLVPAKLGTPFALPSYKKAREEIAALRDTSLINVAGELLDSICVTCYPEQPLGLNEEGDFLPALLALANEYLGRSGEALSPSQTALKEELSRLLDENPPLTA